MSQLTPEFATYYRDLTLTNFANEVETTKKLFARIPDDKRDYRPDPHARTAWELAWHIANTDIQFLDGIADMNFAMTNPPESEKPRNSAELVTWYEKNYDRAVQRVRALSGEQLITPVNFMGIFNLPAVFYLGFLNNHSIHHRGELATYMRPMGARCPAIYGGSYDEPFNPAASTAA